MYLFKQVVYGGPSFVPQQYQISSAHYMALGKSLCINSLIMTDLELFFCMCVLKNAMLFVLHFTEPLT